MSSIPDGDASTGTSSSAPSGSARPPAVPETCANCGRTFVGDYCPACGQRAEPELSIISILGGFVRELIDTERGLWRTFRDLTLHPGTAVRAYLAGARQPFTNPGRYLLVGALVITAFSATLQGVGAPDSNIGRLAVIVANGFRSGLQGAGETAPLEGTAWSAAVQDLEQLGAYPALVLMLIAGLVGLLYWALFRRDTNSPAEAFAVGTYATAHAVILYQCTNVVFELLVHYGALETGISTTFEWALRVLLFVYPSVLTYGCFGASMRNSVKGGLGFAWGYIEAAFVALVGLAGYAEWLLWAYPNAYSGSGPGMAVAVALAAVLLLVHGAFELYARYRHGGHSA
ncbi:hypothetical protein GGP65_000850 [Salinibacter ruber]|uniref:DUF3667 domain-containing protein n=1 Tax=Salinibacter ruber TaxID=146919 RepID=A0AAW5P598_9BACT|nr:DUF3667 domain-containing protein [Salinibacter ruber]MCS3663247.1 hypothetical protein [Salinibacter ruber]MCS4156436.1 hypothetical protein [Salinibacter ruber]MCS4221768.1 hypothetical protein [Salinibacter ruber]